MFTHILRTCIFITSIMFAYFLYTRISYSRILYSRILCSTIQITSTTQMTSKKGGFTVQTYSGPGKGGAIQFTYNLSFSKVV